MNYYVFITLIKRKIMSVFTHLDESLDNNFSPLRQKIRKAIREEYRKSKDMGGKKAHIDLEFLLNHADGW